MTVVTCPTCQKEVIWSPESEFRPFCSKRCQIIDLGDWASEKHTIPSQEDAPMSGELE
ncbi:DNA gyrase inhibitor [Pasteurellaceae bacterium Macca]|nr:DNA gyrase inhibitor [Pasteurellaceae bacterium Macca]